MDKIKIVIPEIYEPLFEPKRFKIISGGRSSAKSESVARILLIMASNHFERVLCTREVQVSIKDSVHQLLSDIINLYEMPGYVVQEKRIYNKITGSEFIFKGLGKGGVENIKSIKGITKVWIEEASTVTKKSLNLLLPSIREDNSEIWATYNRYEEEDPIHAMFALKPDKLVLYFHTTFEDNGFHPDVMEQQRQFCLRNEPDLYDWIWEGQPLDQTEQSVMKYSSCKAMFDRNVDQGEIVRIGCDVARFGTDLTTIWKFKGNKLVDYKIIKKNTVNQCVDAVIAIAESKKDLIRVDATGVGGGVEDGLKAKGYSNTQGINNNDTPKNTKSEKKFKDAITEMFFEFRDDHVNNLDLSIITDSDLKNKICFELSNRRYKITNEKPQKYKVESKDELKKRNTGKSPDHGDGILLAWYDKGGNFHSWTS